MTDRGYSFPATKMFEICNLVQDNFDFISAEAWLKGNGFELESMTEHEADMIISELRIIDKGRRIKEAIHDSGR
jgi:hypothetical protein